MPKVSSQQVIKVSCLNMVTGQTSVIDLTRVSGHTSVTGLTGVDHQRESTWPVGQVDSR